ncbi:MAG: hypothetical protein ACOYL6_17585 [Bacteriovoracaceae bacterium]
MIKKEIEREKQIDELYKKSSLKRVWQNFGLGSIRITHTYTEVWIFESFEKLNQNLFVNFWSEGYIVNKNLDLTKSLPKYKMTLELERNDFHSDINRHRSLSMIIFSDFDYFSLKDIENILSNVDFRDASKYIRYTAGTW